MSSLKTRFAECAIAHPVAPPQREGFIRLLAGFALNVALWSVFNDVMNSSSNIEREVRDALIGGSLAAATLVFVTPVFWRGAPWQAPLAFVLIFFLPGFVLLSVISTIFGYW